VALLEQAALKTVTAYNQFVVPADHLLRLRPIRLRRMRRFASWACFALVLALSLGAGARGQTAADLAADQATPGQVADRGRILLVLPFDNRTGQLNLEWIREAAADLLSSRFRSAGFAPMSRSDRMYALDHLGLPQGFQPSRASSIKLAQTLDADSIVVGSYSLDGKDIVAEAQLVSVPNLRMTPPITARGPLNDMIAVFDSLAWKLTRQRDPSFNVASETFVAAGKSLRLDAFEQYIRGIAEPDQAERLRHLNQAVKLSPDYSAAWMALAREDYNSQQYEQAAMAFSKVDRNGMDGLEAGFYRGLSLLFFGDYSHAEQAFAEVARILPLAEVVNNQGVAISRQGRDGTSLFVQAAADDPDDADYHFNLAISLKRQRKVSAAESELAQCLKLHPNDSEAQSLLQAWKQPVTAQDATEASVDPLERIVRTFDAAAFRQAVLVMDQMDASHLAAYPPLVRAQRLSVQAKGYLDRGLLLEAERLYQSAVDADPKAPEAHVGLAEVRERTGDSDAARKEASLALQLGPSAEAYLVLGQLDLAADHLDDANRDASQALKLAPASPDAQALERQILARTGQRK
jgi:tetratricopeptide (TPR) repeat protein/nucleotide-binding universal stress UspA family protein